MGRASYHSRCAISVNQRINTLKRILHIARRGNGLLAFGKPFIDNVDMPTGIGARNIHERNFHFRDAFATGMTAQVTQDLGFEFIAADRNFVHSTPRKAKRTPTLRS